MKKSNLKVSTLMMLLIFISNNSSAMSQLTLVEIDEVDVRSKTLVIGGLKYQFELNQDVSEYNDEEDTSKLVSLRSLRAGNKYYVTFHVNDGTKAINSTGYDKVIFIANDRPSE